MESRLRLIFLGILGLAALSPVSSALASEPEVCAKTYKEIEASSSKTLKDALPTIRGKRFTNLSNGTHVRFSENDRLELATYSTTSRDGGDLEFTEGSIRICEIDGEIKIESTLSSRPVPVIFDGKGCFRLGGIAAIGGDRVKFCPGEMPAHVQAALDRDTKDREARSRDIAANPDIRNESRGAAR